MAEKVASLYVELGLIADKLKSGLSDAKTRLSGFSKGVDGAVQNLTGLSLESLGAAGAITALGAGLKASIDAAAEAQRVMAQTESVIKATGGAAGFTAEQIAALANREAALTGIDDEVVQSGENMLLTFRNIGGSTLPRATRAMEDMAVAMAQGDASAVDLKSTAIQLGKALNDPLNGMTALQRVGVTFSAEQKKLIKSMMEVNDIAGAQGVILQELESEFGGAAAAAGGTFEGSMNKLKTTVGNVEEEIGGALIPTLQKAADALNLLLTANDQITGALVEHEAQVRDTSGSYADYINELNRAAGVVGLQVDAEGNLVKVYSNGMGITKKVIAEHYAMTEAQMNAKQSTDALTAAEQSYQDGLDATAPAIYDVDNALKAHYITAGQANQQMKALRDSTLGYGKAVSSSSDLLSEFNANLVFNKAAAKLDSEAALQLGRSLGLVDEKTITFYSSLDALTTKFDANRDGAISASEGAAEYARQVANLKYYIDHLQSKTVTVTVNTVNSSNNFAGGGPQNNPNATSGRAAGGPVVAGTPYIVGEHRPELFVPRQSGDILPYVPSGGGGGDTYVENHFHSAGAVALGMAIVATGRRSRLDASMGM
jgi:hypothetical protein